MARDAVSRSGAKRSVAKTDSRPLRMASTRSKPAPVSMFFFGSSVSVPSALRSYCVNTRFQNSTKRSPVLLATLAAGKRREEGDDERDDHQDDDHQVGDADLDYVPLDVVARRIQRKDGGKPAKHHEYCRLGLRTKTPAMELRPITWSNDHVTLSIA